MVDVELNPQSAIRNRQSLCVAWQGVQLVVPADWSPVKIEGDFDRGFLSMADLDRERVGLRWQTIGKRSDPVKLVDGAMRNEVGKLAFDESIDVSGGDWTVARLYVEPDPPGRDVWVGFCGRTRRLVQVVYQAKRRDRVLRDDLVPTFRDTGEVGGLAKVWSVFWLNVSLPRPMKLTGQRLNVGDLSLTFASDAGPVVVRQVAAAGVALNRRPIEKWLMSLAEPKRYRPFGEPGEVVVNGMTGMRQCHARRRRLFLARWIAREFVVYAVHDASADRLTLARAPDERVAVATIEGIGTLNVEQ